MNQLSITVASSRIASGDYLDQINYLQRHALQVIYLNTIALD